MKVISRSEAWRKELLEALRIKGVTHTSDGRAVTDDSVSNITLFNTLVEFRVGECGQ